MKIKVWNNNGAGTFWKGQQKWMEEPYCKRDGTYWRSYYQKEKNDANAKSQQA